MIRKYIEVNGLVQGVGFRPFVYRIALENHLRGFVKNSSVGAIIDVEGEESSVEDFLKDLQHKGPSLSTIENINITSKEFINYKTFEIRKSSKEFQGFTFISPDLGVCEDCLHDVMNEKDKRHLYPFTNCTNCGPRYSIVKALPYDRVVTTMKDFAMCSPCLLEYDNPLDRRFHAQPNCCPHCGPQLELLDNNGNAISCVDKIKETVKLIKEGNIFSIKGIGGFHLVCNGKNHKAIEKLRKRKHRETKPFAVMMKDIEMVKKYCFLSSKEEEVLCSNKRPIVILEKKYDEGLPDVIAPGNKTLGVMLPYTPLHYLLFDEDLDILIMTSANMNGMPIIYENEKSLTELKEIVDYHLINNRDIYTSVDDSVVRVVLGKEMVIRRGRGYSPTYFKGKGFKESLSLGAHYKNTFCFCKDGNIILSQYIGDLDNEETKLRQERARENLRTMYDINPNSMVYDIHPSFFSTEILEKSKEKRVGVYHHHAHIASVLFENKVKDKVIGIAYDGVGYGEDGALWGGEFFICDLKDFKRVAHLQYVAMPGGDKAAMEPRRMGISYLYYTFHDESENKIEEIINDRDGFYIESPKDGMYIEMIKKHINSPQTSSMGRLFDGVAWLLGFDKNISFEGEAAIYLENICDGFDHGVYDYVIDNISDNYVIRTESIIQSIADDIKKKISKEVIARKFHNTIIEFTVNMCIKLRNDYDIEKAALSGGVFQNKILLEGIYGRLKECDFEVYINKDVPCNDGGISLGQLVIANEREMG